MFFPSVAQTASEFARVAKLGGHVVTALWTRPDQNRWTSLILSSIGWHVELPAPSLDAPALFRCAATGLIEEALETVGIAAPVVARLAKVNEGTREGIRREVIAQARIDVQGGVVRFGALVICGRKA